MAFEKVKAAQRAADRAMRGALGLNVPHEADRDSLVKAYHEHLAVAKTLSHHARRLVRNESPGRAVIFYRSALARVAAGITCLSMHNSLHLDPEFRCSPDYRQHDWLRGRIEDAMHDLKVRGYE